MCHLILSDGETTLTISGAGASGGYLWIHGLQSDMLNAVRIFGTPAQTRRITVRYGDGGAVQPDVYEGYTQLEAVMADEETGVKVCMKEAG